MNVLASRAQYVPQGGMATMHFRVGDYVERIGILVPEYMKRGVIIRIIPNPDGVEIFTEYEVNFGNQIIANFYHSQLRLIPPPPISSEQKPK
jgi:hypothetical protein